MRQRCRGSSRIAVICCLLLQAAGSCTSNGDRAATPSSSPPVQAETFPGGGAILFSGGSGLQAAFPDGSARTIGPFFGAEPFPGLQLFPSGQVLAWKVTREDYDYYVMRMDGTDRRHVLAPTRRKIPFSVQISSDGTKLAYIRDTYLGPGHPRYDLLVQDLSTGRSMNLGRIAPAGPKGDFTYAFAWNNDSVLLLVQSSDRGSIDWVNLESRTRGTYVSVADRRIVEAYGRIRPKLTPPTEIRPIGWTPNRRFTGFAILVSGQDGSDPAVVVLKNGQTRAFAVPRDATGVELTWALTSTRFLLASWVDERRGPTDWTLSVGDARTGDLRQIVRTPRIRGSLLNPDGDVVVYAPNVDSWVFVTIEGCSELRLCDERIDMEGFPLAWVA
jgi:hypothetical protein